jgi:tetratricopeptide (TPR) repeat protein
MTGLWKLQRIMSREATWGRVDSGRAVKQPGRIRTARILFLVLLVSLLASAVCFGQTAREDRDRIMRDARQLARRGNRVAALQILEGLYAENPLDQVVVREYSGMLVAASQYERAEEVLRDFISRSPDDMKAVKAGADLASLYFKRDDPDRGREIIDGIIDRAPRELWPYQLGLDAYIDNDMKDDILAFIARARSALNDSTLFAVDAARAHEGKEEYAGATREYLIAALPGDKDDEVAHYIIRMARLDEARPEVISSLERAREIDAFADVAGRAIWEVRLMDGECARALEEILKLGPANEPGAALMAAFAERAAQEGCFGKCSEAYALAISYAPHNSRVPYYMLKKAECEMVSGLTDDALATYDEVAARYRASKWASMAVLERARIYKDLGRLAEAADEADRVIASERDPAVRSRTILFKGDLQVLSGDLDQAFETYDLVSTEWEDQYAQEAFFNLGEISFYRAEFDEALSYYNVTLREYPGGTRANDAVDRLFLIKSSGGGGEYNPNLEIFARALLERRQGRHDQAIAGFLASAGTSGDLGTYSLVQISEIRAETGDFERAIRTYRLVGDTLDVYLSPSALEAVGDVYMGMGRTDEAIGAYENVILKYPGSVSAGEARRKMDLVRRNGDGS